MTRAVRVSRPPRNSDPRAGISPTAAQLAVWRLKGGRRGPSTHTFLLSPLWPTQETPLPRAVPLRLTQAWKKPVSSGRSGDQRDGQSLGKCQLPGSLDEARRGGNGRAESPSDHQLKRPIPTPLRGRPPCLACTCPQSAQLQAQREAGVSGVWRDGESQQGRVTSRSRTSSPSLLLPVPRRFPSAEEGDDHAPDTHTLLHPHSFTPTSQTSSSGSGWRARPGPGSPFQLSLGIQVGGVWGTPSQGLPGTKVTPGPPSPFPALDL